MSVIGPCKILGHGAAFPIRKRDPMETDIYFAPILLKKSAVVELACR